MTSCLSCARHHGSLPPEVAIVPGSGHRPIGGDALAGPGNQGYPYPVRPQSTAFTLIELLVVISIIAILAAMLLPAIGLVRDQAKQTKCQSGQRQMAMACTAYAGDQEGMLPDLELTNSGYWTVLVFDYLEQTAKPMNGTAYTSANFVQSCPEFGKNMTGSAFALNGQLRKGDGGTNDDKFHNHWAETSKTFWTPFAIGTLMKPTGRLYLSDSFINPLGTPTVYRNYVLPSNDSAALMQTGLRHRGKMMGVFLDGHGGVIRAGDFASAYTGNL